jgi:2-oxoglutarate ferredoxin oxidoreductase subunit alpha
MTFAKTCASIGLYVFGKREYHSNIKGAHSYYPLSISDKYIRSHSDYTDLLATFDKETFLLHKDFVVSNGAIIFDKDLFTMDDAKSLVNNDILLIPVPYNDIIKEASIKFEKEKEYSKLQIMRNVIAVSASFALLNLDFEYLKKVLETVFTGRRAKLLEINIFAGSKAYEYILQNNYNNKFNYELKPLENKEEKILLGGTTATAIGKIVAGCRFQTYYPITPASDESEYLEAHPEYGVVTIQTEDEIAAICMAIGASLAGVRAATSTSGPGFSLMAEAQGWAGINEVPIVIFNYQRGGPSTGLPTRHEQGDLEFALHAGHSEFPRIVLSPGDIEESFYLTIQAFNLAEKYQLPVIFLSDKAIANSIQTIKPFDLSGVTINRGKLVTEKEIQEIMNNGKVYKRFLFTEDGISPRAFLGQELVFWNTGDEHDELGHISEDPINRNKMFDKRMRKLQTALKDIPTDLKYKLYGPNDFEYLVVGWGSVKGPVLDVLEELNQYYKTAFLQIILLNPFPIEIKDILLKAKVIIDVEMNYSAQLSKLIKQNAGIDINRKIVKFNGRPISRTELKKALIDSINLEKERIVLEAGV